MTMVLKRKLKDTHTLIRRKKTAEERMTNQNNVIQRCGNSNYEEKTGRHEKKWIQKVQHSCY